MPVLTRSIVAPLVVDVGAGAVDRLGETLSSRGIADSARTALVVSDRTGRVLGERARRSLGAGDVLAIRGGTVAAANELGERLRGHCYDAVVALGGGRIIDTVKYATFQHGLPVVAVATSLSHDGIASPVSVLERDGVSVSYGTHIPLAAVVDLDYVRRSPVRQTRSGIGDALSNLSAVADWELAAAVRHEPVDGLAVTLASTGAEALLSHPGGAADDDFLLVLANALILGGIAMAVAGSSRPCSGGCHEIAHALTQRHPGLATHGEQAALGALFCTHLRGDTVRLAQLSGAYRRHGLARTPGELGLTVHQFAAAVHAAPATRPGRYTILEHLDLDPDQIEQAVIEFAHAVVH
jgi:glycerol-1-phosphate dehydrogenase [NAD(P)+]